MNKSPLEQVQERILALEAEVDKHKARRDHFEDLLNDSIRKENEWTKRALAAEKGGAELRQERDELTTSYESFRHEIGVALHPNGDGPLRASGCDLVKYVGELTRERDTLSVQMEAAEKALQEFFTLSARNMFSVPDDLFVPVQKASAILSAHAPTPSQNDSTTDPFYPEILKNPHPVFEVTGNEWEGKALACALGLDAWAWVMMGNKPPDHFGMTMARLGQFLGCMATAEGLSEYSEKYILGENPLPGAPTGNLKEG